MCFLTCYMFFMVDMFDDDFDEDHLLMIIYVVVHSYIYKALMKSVDDC